MKQSPLPIWKYLAHLIRYAWGSYLLNLLLWLLLVVGPSLATGLIVRAIFDTLTNSAPLTIGLVGLMTLLITTAVVEMGILIVSEASNILMRLNVSSLLRRNLFAHLLQQPGAKSLPQSPSEAISRFRDDIKTVENLVSSTANPIGQLIFIIVAVAVMIRINLLLTLVVFLPLLAMLLIASAARHRLQRYHEARQVATGQVTGFIGEMFGAIQAIKVNTAIGEIDHSIQQNAATSEETASASEEMSAQAEQMKAIVDAL